MAGTPGRPSRSDSAVNPNHFDVPIPTAFPLGGIQTVSTVRRLRLVGHDSYALSAVTVTRARPWRLRSGTRNTGARFSAVLKTTCASQKKYAASFVYPGLWW